MESENLEILIGQVESRVKAEQAVDTYKSLYENALQQIAEKNAIIEQKNRHIAELEKKLSFMFGANAFMKFSNLICLNSKKFLDNLLRLKLKGEFLLTTVALVGESLYEGTPRDSYDEAKTEAYRHLMDDNDRSYVIKDGGTYVEHEVNYNKA